jgi:autoinducer 2 (AI-2) kinase
MASSYVLALDAGSGSGRSVLISTDGRECHTAARDWGYVYEPDVHPSACHLDPDAFWASLAQTVREVLTRAGADGRQVVAVSSTSQREGCVLLDGAGSELYAGPNRDLRAQAEGAELASTHGEQIYERTGHYPSAMFAAARLRWFQRHRPELVRRSGRLLMLNDWVLYRLSGICASEPTNAAETCLFDIHTQTWADDLVEELGLPASLLPDVVSSGTVIGAVTPAAARATGLRSGTPVVAGGADTQCGVLGSGASAEGDVAVVAGTTTPLQMILSAATIDPNRRLWSAPYLLPSTFVLESNAGAAGTVYRWCADSFVGNGLSSNGKGSSWDGLNARAASIPAGAGGVKSFVGVTVMNAKNVWAPMAVLELGSLVWEGDTPAAIARAVLESLAFAARANAAQLAAAAPVPVRRITACGGLTRSDLYLTLLASCLGRKVSVPRWREGSGVGAAVCAAVGAGVYSNLTLGQQAMVSVDRTVEPDPELVSAYDALFPIWLEEFDTLAARARKASVN